MSNPLISGEQKWYVIITRPRAEKKVSSGLGKSGIIHFLPLQKQLRQWKDRKKWVELPLFHSYLFVRIADQYRNDVFEVPGVLRYLSVKGVPCTVSGDEIERICRICKYEKDIIVTEQLLEMGDEVEVVQGPLQGIRGKLLQKVNGTYLHILIRNIGYTASFKIESSIVKKVT